MYKAVLNELHSKFDRGDVEGYDTFEKWIVDKALTEGGPYLDAILRRVMPASKATYPTIEFEFDTEWSHTQKADAIMNSIASGNLPPDIGHMLIDGLAKMLGIEEITDLAKRLEAIEKLLDAQKA